MKAQTENVPCFTPEFEWQTNFICAMCRGDYCQQHFNRPCDCDVLDRHERPICKAIEKP